MTAVIAFNDCRHLPAKIGYDMMLRMKNKQAIEPGVLNIFRLLVLVELLGSTLQLLRARVMPLTNLTASWVQIPAVKELYNLHLSWLLYLPWTLSLLALLIYLVIPSLEKTLGVVYLPIALAFQTVLLIVRLIQRQCSTARAR